MSGRETIAAIATPPGRGGVGILRVSGERVPRIARSLLGRPPRPRFAHLFELRDAQGETLDRGLLLHFPAPHSFTEEDVLELHLHGSPLLLQMALARMCELGARPARAGEFSERAFIEGKLDLTQAEAIADLISAASEQAVRAATRSLQGVFSQLIHSLLSALIELRMHVEAAIDFPEEEIDFLADGQVEARLQAVKAELARITLESQRGQRLRDGLHLVILGRPNAGKSSLLNALAGIDVAIVTEQPGTTRDLLRESLNLDGVPLTLVDTAGLRDTDDIVEREGLRRARAELARADHVLVVLGSEDPQEAAALTEDIPAGIPVTWVHNKIDARNVPAHSEITDGAAHFHLSALTGEGLDALRAHLRELGGLGEGSQGVFSARARHLDALKRVSEHLDAAHTRLINDRAGELVAEELRCAHDALSAITGEFTADDLLGEIFGSFCIGK